MSVLGNWSLDILIRGIPIARGDPDACEDVVYALSHSSLKPVVGLPIVPVCVDEDAFLATDGNGVDPSLSVNAG
jgi:hypothetical protein